MENSFLKVSVLNVLKLWVPGISDEMQVYHLQSPYKLQNRNVRDVIQVINICHACYYLYYLCMLIFVYCANFFTSFSFQSG